jgi:116 kDa U5 small nuclear ribonucleoprotein component
MLVLHTALGTRVGTREFAKRLWGNVYFQPDSRTFKRKPPPGGGVRTFVQFILEPLYKLYSQTLGEDAPTLKRTLDELGIPLKREQYKLDTIPLLKLVLSSFFGRAAGLVDMLVQKIPSPAQAARSKVSHFVARSFE